VFNLPFVSPTYTSPHKLLSKSIRVHYLLTIIPLFLVLQLFPLKRDKDFRYDFLNFNGNLQKPNKICLFVFILSLVFNVSRLSGKKKNLSAQRSNSNTVWFNFQMYINI
jgi:hypothetical protein